MGRLSLFAVVVGLVAASCATSNAATTTTSAATELPPTTTTATTAPADRPTTTTTTQVPPTSQAPQVTEPPSGVTISGRIGVVGCSNTAGAVDGYTTVSEADILTEGGLTGGSIAVWGNPRPARYQRYWGMYDERRPEEGYAAAWVQLCIRSTEHNGSFDDDQQVWIENIISAVHERDAGIPIWISGVNTFEDGLVCPTVGLEGPAIASEAADWAATAIPGMQRGPDLGPMLAEHLDPGETCHPNTPGRAMLGTQLANFFDGTSQ